MFKRGDICIHNDNVGKWVVYDDETCLGTGETLHITEHNLVVEVVSVYFNKIYYWIPSYQKFSFSDDIYLTPLVPNANV